jgi:alpha-beta hydrolase superfamily lysophospholipase
MTFRRPPARHLAAALVAVLAILAAAVPSEAATKKRKGKKKPAPIPEVARPHDPFEVTFPTSDGVRLVATWRPSPAGPAAPAVLLLHAFSRERREVADVADELVARGFSTLALDLRGHGDSVRKGSTRIGVSPSLQTSPNAFPRDVEAACGWLRSRSSRVGVLGLSLSGNLAAIATATDWAEAGVAVSPNADRLAPLAGSRSSTPKGLLVLASEKDPGRAESARTLDAAGLEPKAVVLYPGAAHALELLRTEAAAKGAAFAWLEARLGPVSPPPAPVTAVAPPDPAPPPEATATPAPDTERP